MISEANRIEEIVNNHKNDSSALIQVMLDIQRENHWISKDILVSLSQKMGIPLTQVYQVGTFYKIFSLKPRGRHLIRVCVGTACHTRGAPKLVDGITDVLKLQPGDTSADMMFSFNTVNCLGCCTLGPVMELDGIYYSNPSKKDMEKIFNSCL